MPQPIAGLKGRFHSTPYRLPWCRRLGCTAWSLALALGLGATAGSAQTADEAIWPVAGRQGIIRIVIVPMEQARDRAAYARQVAHLCQTGQTCFINFFTNSKAAPVDVPLPDAIADEATAIYRHSMKQGAELFRWSCRLAIGEGDCF